MMLGDAVAGAPPRRTKIKGDPHFLAYITDEEAAMLRDAGGGMERDGEQIVGPGGVPAFFAGDNADSGTANTSGDSTSSVSDASDASGGFSNDSNVSGNDTSGAVVSGPAPAPAPTGPTPEQLAQQKLTADRGAATAQLRDAWGSRIGDALFDSRETAFRSRYPGQIDQSYQEMLTRSLGGMDPELRATPIAWNVQRGLADQRDNAKAGLTQAWEGAESGMRGRANARLNANVGQIQGADDPFGALQTSLGELDALAAEYSAATPEYRFSLDAGNPANGVVSLTRPGEEEQIQAERLRTLLANLPSLSNSARMVG